MSVSKAEIKIAVASEIGCGLDDALEAAQAQVAEARGGNKAAVMLSHAMMGLLKDVDAKLDLDDPPFDLEVAGKIKHYLRQALAKCETVAKQSDNRRLQCEGRVQAFEQSVKNVKKIVDSEHAKAQVHEARESDDEGENEGGVNGRAVGDHPGSGLAAERRAEDKAAKATKKKAAKKPARKAAKKKATKRGRARASHA